MAACIDRTRAQTDLDDERGPPLILFLLRVRQSSPLFWHPRVPPPQPSVDRPTLGGTRSEPTHSPLRSFISPSCSHLLTVSLLTLEQSRLFDDLRLGSCHSRLTRAEENHRVLSFAVSDPLLVTLPVGQLSPSSRLQRASLTIMACFSLHLLLISTAALTLPLASAELYQGPTGVEYVKRFTPSAAACASGAAYYTCPLFQPNFGDAVAAISDSSSTVGSEILTDCVYNWQVGVLSNGQPYVVQPALSTTCSPTHPSL